LDLKEEQEIKEAFDILNRKEGKIIMQKMIKADAEVIIGAKKRSGFRRAYHVGSGGIHVEYLKDLDFAVTPVNKNDMLELIANTKIASQIPDKELFWPVFESLQNLLSDFPGIEEIDLNPIVISQNELYCVDIKIKVSKNDCPVFPKAFLNPRLCKNFSSGAGVSRL